MASLVTRFSASMLLCTSIILLLPRFIARQNVPALAQRIATGFVNALVSLYQSDHIKKTMKIIKLLIVKIFSYLTIKNINLFYSADRPCKKITTIENLRHTNSFTTADYKVSTFKDLKI